MEIWTAKSSKLIQLPLNERKKNLPKHLQHIVTLAEMLNLNPQKIWIYGSRARGDARENSDFDLAFEIANQSNWSEFRLKIEDEPPSVFRYDLVDVSKCDEKLRKVIFNEGVQIYGKE